MVSSITQDNYPSEPAPCACASSAQPAAPLFEVNCISPVADNRSIWLYLIKENHHDKDSPSSHRKRKTFPSLKLAFCHSKRNRAHAASEEAESSFSWSRISQFSRYSQWINSQVLCENPGLIQHRQAQCLFIMGLKHEAKPKEQTCLYWKK